MRQNEWPYHREEDSGRSMGTGGDLSLYHNLVDLIAIETLYGYGENAAEVPARPPSGESLGEFHRFPEEPITPQRIPFQDSRKDAILVNVEDECSLIR